MEKSDFFCNRFLDILQFWWICAKKKKKKKNPSDKLLFSILYVNYLKNDIGPVNNFQCILGTVSFVSELNAPFTSDSNKRKSCKKRYIHEAVSQL